MAERSSQSGTTDSPPAVSGQRTRERDGPRSGLLRGGECVSAHERKPVALLILSGGGFTFETKCLLNGIKADFDLVYLKTEFGGTPGTGGIPDAEWHKVPAFGSFTRRSIRKSIKAFVMTFITTAKLLRDQKIDLIVCVGCSHAVPMLLAGRIFRRTTTFIESITRVDKLSNTGRLVYHLRLARTFIIQWPALRDEYPSSTLGTIL